MRAAIVIYFTTTMIADFVGVQALSTPTPFKSATDTSTHPSTQQSSFNDEEYRKVGKDIPTISTWEYAWEVANRFWTPNDHQLPIHYTCASSNGSNLVHHEKRLRWASQFLLHISTLRNDLDNARLNINNTALRRVLQAAALYPSTTTTYVDRIDKEGVWLLDSLIGIHALVGRSSSWNVQQPGEASNSDTTTMDNSATTMIQLLINRVAALDYPRLDHACRAYWAIHGLVARVDGLSLTTTTTTTPIVFEHRVKALPFQIIPLGVDWSKLKTSATASDTTSTSGTSTTHDDICQTLVQTIPFQKDVIVTRRGEKVQERRGTAWIAKEGIGALAYSGKLMPPQPLPELVLNVMRTVEQKLNLSPQQQQQQQKTPWFFDCALCNHYADAAAACKFHTDPEHGTKWDRTTVVVAAGSDRIFAFKPIATTWRDWDLQYRDTVQDTVSNGGADATAAAITLFSGDLVVMRDNCNDDFYHAVYSGITDEERVSLVLKRAISRGHGLAGEGRRGRAKRMMTSTTPALPNDGSKNRKVMPTSSGPGRSKATRQGPKR